MLSEYEERELAVIAEMLSSDRHLSATFANTPPPRGPRRHRLERVLAVCGIAIMVASTILGLGDAFVGGLLLAVAGFGARRLLARVSEPRVRGPRPGRDA